MSTTAQKLKDFEDAIRSRAMQAAHPIKGFDVLLSEEDGCVTVQWTGQMPKSPVSGWLAARKERAAKGHGPQEVRCEAKIFFRSGDAPPEGWPSQESESMVSKSPPKWPSQFSMTYVVIARRMSGKAPTDWEQIEPRGKKASFASAGQCADYFIKAISRPTKEEAKFPLGGALTAAGVIVALSASAWYGFGVMFPGQDDDAGYESPYNSPSVFGTFDDGEEDDGGYGAAGPRANLGGARVSNSDTAEEGYSAGGTGDESSNGIASEGYESIDGVDGADGAALAGAAAGPLAGHASFADLPYCWTDAAGAPEPAVAVYREPGGIRLEPFYPQARADQFASLPLQGLIFSHPLSAAEFEKTYEPIFLYSLDKGCRLAVQEMGSASPELNLEGYRQALSGYFYIIPEKP